MSFEEISHTADVKIRATAPTLEFLFSEAFACPDAGPVWPRPERRNKTGDHALSAEDHESLLATFSQKSSLLLRLKGWFFPGRRSASMGITLVAILDGEPFDRNRHALGTEVKGISYSGLVDHARMRTDICWISYLMYKMNMAIKENPEGTTMA